MTHNEGSRIGIIACFMINWALGRIVIFDSGLGSLSIIRAIKRTTSSHMVYFADQKNFPYGTLSVLHLRKIITERIMMLEERFKPDIVVVGSNTPTLLLERLPGKRTIGVLPPLVAAANATKTGGVAILATHSVSRSPRLLKYIHDSGVVNKDVRISRIDCSSLVNLVESGDFMTNGKKCSHIIRNTLQTKFKKNCIDSATLSSTHLPFLLPILQKEFPNVKFFDPADNVASIVKKRIVPSTYNRLSVYTSSDPKALQTKLAMLGIKHRVSFLA
ncbi:MAG: Asp/Glu/hydantoin racemase [Cenarchaeum symbiont of Oopsacas minuta]|nr:Asp/Glu/hydantoin racemase [Cenarchaeum symbiont of Oopsacas minuta]